MPPTTTRDDMNLSVGKRARLHRLLYGAGPANGTLMLMPIDQGMEHGPVTFFDNPASADPEFQLRLAHQGGYSGIVFHVGLARKYMHRYAGVVPLVLKLNGKTNIPSDSHALSPQTATVEEAVALGADAVGYTLYLGSPRQDEDFIQFMEIRAEADRLGIPVIVWAYPRGEAGDARGGKDSLYAIDYGARVASELGADMVKLNVPVLGGKGAAAQPAPYDTLQMTTQEALNKIVASAGRTMVIISGGSKLGDDDLLEKAEMCMKAGATGLIFGRNMWQRPWDDGMEMTRRIHEMLAQYGTPAPPLH